MNIRSAIGATAAGVISALPLAATVYSVRVLERLDEPVAVVDHSATISPTYDSYMQSTAAELKTAWSTPDAAYAPNWQGTVTKLEIAPGQTVRALDVVIQVDGIDRIGWSSETWFYRQLRLGDRGRDVAELQELLSHLGYELSGDTLALFGAETRSAVRELEARILLPKTTGVFDPAWLVRLPARGVTVVDIAAQVGNPAPPAGAAILTGAPALSQGTVTVVGEPLAAVENGIDLVAVLPDGSTVRVDHELHVVDSDLASVRAYMFAQGSVQIEDAQKGSALPVVLQTATVGRGWVIPATAINIGSTGETCVYVQSSAEASESVAVVVKADGPAPSTVFVEADLTEADHVVVSPSLPPGGTPCA